MVDKDKAATIALEIFNSRLCQSFIEDARGELPEDDSYGLSEWKDDPDELMLQIMDGMSQDTERHFADEEWVDDEDMWDAINEALVPMIEKAIRKEQ